MTTVQDAGQVDKVDDEERARDAILESLQPGTIVDGKYRLDNSLGRGGMGVVVAATHLELGERVAIKFLRLAKASPTPDFALRFRREARLSARLRSEHFARVIDVGMWREQVPYMVMEHLVGGDLGALIKWAGPLPLEMVLDFATQLCSALAVVHALGAVHRDLKSANVFLTLRPDGSPLVKLLDFGISKWGEDAESIDITRAGMILGSPRYMSPEQLFASHPIDTRTDVWAAGVIIYEMLAGKLPYDYPTMMGMYGALASDAMPAKLETVRPDVSREFEVALCRCFERDPAKRVQNVGELAGSLLEAARVPAAAALRQRIMATLDPSTANAMRESLATAVRVPTPATIGSISSSGASLVEPTAPPGSTDSSVSISIPQRKKPSRQTGLWVGAGSIAAVAAVALLRSPHPTIGGQPPEAVGSSASAAPHAEKTAVAALPSGDPSDAEPAATADPTSRATTDAPHAPSAPPSVLPPHTSWTAAAPSARASSSASTPLPKPMATPPPAVSALPKSESQILDDRR